MSTLFGNLKSQTENVEAATDRVGGGFNVHDTSIYEGDVKVLYAGKSDGGANFLQVIIENVVNATTRAPVSDYRETVYFTSGTAKGGLCTYEKNGKKYYMPGYTNMNDLLLATTGAELFDANFEEKMVNVYDYEQKKEIPKAVPVAVDAIGARIAFAVYKSKKDKQTKAADGTYVATGEFREEASIEKIYLPEIKLTILEAQEVQKQDRDPVEADAIHWPAWLAAHEGKVKDDTTKGAGNAGAPPKTGAAPQGNTSSAAAETKKALFGKK